MRTPFGRSRGCPRRPPTRALRESLCAIVLARNHVLAVPLDTRADSLDSILFEVDGLQIGCQLESCRHVVCRPSTLSEVDELQVALGKRIRGRRLQLGFSQESFADHCELHRTYMGAIERGERNVTIHTLITVAKGLGTNLSELLSGIEDQIKESR